MIEVVITIILLGIVVVPVMRSVIMTITASASAQSASEVETALLNAVDRVNRADFDRCDYKIFAQAAVQTQGWDKDQITATQGYLDHATDLFIEGPTGALDPGPACPETGFRTDLIQEISITVTSPDGRVTRTIQVVKSNV